MGIVPCSAARLGTSRLGAPHELNSLESEHGGLSTPLLVEEDADEAEGEADEAVEEVGGVPWADATSSCGCERA